MDGFIQSTNGRVVEDDAALVQHLGARRTEQQDAAYLGSGLFVVCDGMGGHDRGAEAAELAVKFTTEYARKDYSDSQWQNLVQALHDEIVKQLHGGRFDRWDGAGTTMIAGVQESDGTWTLIHIGDSRAYGWDERRNDGDGAWVQLTEDHEYPNGALMKVLGHGGDADIIRNVTGSFLVATDGLWANRGFTLDGVFGDPIDICVELTEDALKRGGSDNITVLVVR